MIMSIHHRIEIQTHLTKGKNLMKTVTTKKSRAALRDAIWFPHDMDITDRVKTLADLIQAELPIHVRIYGFNAVAIAIEEAIDRRTKFTTAQEPKKGTQK